LTYIAGSYVQTTADTTPVMQRKTTKLLLRARSTVRSDWTAAPRKGKSVD